MKRIVALAGNPNCGKTTLFNELTGAKQHVGNWPGVTVDKKEGAYRKNKEITILDLPGTYSLSPYSAEEIIARDYIVKERPDAVINIIDGTSIERNLYLTLQIMEANIPMVLAINMMDEVKSRGDQIDIKKLESILGIPCIPIVAKTRTGLDELMKAVTRVVEQQITPKELEIYSSVLTNAMEEITAVLPTENASIRHWQAIKLLELDENITGTFDTAANEQIATIVKRAEEACNDDIEAEIADQRYQFIGKVTTKCVKRSTGYTNETKSDKIDKLLTNRILALPIFAAVMYFLFSCTFSENFLFIPNLPSPGIWLASLVEAGWGELTVLLEGVLKQAGASDWAFSLVIDGLMEGVGAVLGFLPLVLVMYLLLSFLEDSGYMARVAFVLDRIFRKFGLSGRSFIPLLMGFGCSVPALMATRTLESEKDRKITCMVTPFMSCGAKLPIYLMFAVTLFADSNKTRIVFAIYMGGIITAIIGSLLLNKFFFKGEASNFIMELPQYRIPTLKSVCIHGWEKVKGFVKKAGTIIATATVLIWLLSNFNVGSFTGENKQLNEDGSIMCEMDDSFLASIGNFIRPVFQPLGFGKEWRPAVGVVTGWIAKENIVATFAQLYNSDNELSDEYLIQFANENYSLEELEELEVLTDTQEVDVDAMREIYTEEILMAGEGSFPGLSADFTKASAIAYMLFNLLCMPCFAAVGAMKRELKTWKWTFRAIGFQMLTAWIVACIVYQIARLLL